MECKKCGSELDFREAFCSKCGELTERGQPIGQKLGMAVGAISRESGKLVSWIIDYVSDQAHRKQVVAGGATIALLLVVLTDNPITPGVSSLFSGEQDSPQLTEDGRPDFASYEDVFIGEEEEFTATGTANVRDFPTSQGTLVMHTYSGGETVVAREVQAFDPTSRWFKLTSGGYVWGGNLDGVGLPELEADVQFPEQFRGVWSSMDRCRGSTFEYDITVSENEISFYESVGRLVSISYDELNRAQYQLAMSGEGNQWTATYDISVTANGVSIMFDDLETSNDMDSVYHRSDYGCGRVFFAD